MKTIINNPDKLNNNEIDITTNKVRAIIIDDSNNIIITKYADIYMLPGGKVNINEKPKDSLIRELKEELGIEFQIEKITPFIEFKNYLKNYPLVNCNKKINKLNKTIYYIIRTNKKINTGKTSLTEREKKDNFLVSYLDLNETIKIISNYNSSNLRNYYFKNELIKVLEEFQLINNNFNYNNILDLEEKTNESAINFLENLYIKTVIEPYKQKEKLIDLHTHSIYSDGELSPNELIRHAIENGIDTVAITDHDTINGIKKLNRNDSIIIDSRIKIIDGIELSAKTDKGRMHILGYGIDIHNEKLNSKLNELRLNSLYSVISLIIQIKNDYGIIFSYDEIKDLINTNSNLGRPDIAKLCIKNGYATSVQDAFDKYLIEAYKKNRKNNKGIPYNECIKLIIDSGGIPVLAHPKTLNLNDKELLYLLKDMINCGLMGIEVYHSSHSKEETDKYFKLANELGLLISGGSDYHGINTKPDVKIGTGINNNLKIKSLSILDKIKR